MQISCLQSLLCPPLDSNQQSQTKAEAIFYGFVPLPIDDETIFINSMKPGSEPSKYLCI